MEGKKILYMPIYRGWFDMILAGVKLEDYREITPYWRSRLLNKSYDYVRLTNGYGKHRPTMLIEFKEICCSLGIIEWGAPADEAVFIIKLGEIVEVSNV